MYKFHQNIATKKERNLQNPEVLDARKVHFSDSGDVVFIQIPVERNAEVSSDSSNQEMHPG